MNIREQIAEQKRKLEHEIARLERDLNIVVLLEEVWLELGPYTSALSNDLRHRLQDYFGFDDSE